MSMNYIKKYKNCILVLIGFTILITIFYLSFLKNGMILSETNIKNQICNKVGYDVKILKNEDNKNYKIILFQANGRLGIATYKLNVLCNMIGNDYIFTYDSIQYKKSMNIYIQKLIKGNDSYNYTILHYGDNQTEVIIYGDNSNKSLESIDINEASNNTNIKLNKQDIFFINRIINNSTPAEIVVNTDKNSIKIFSEGEEEK